MNASSLVYGDRQHIALCTAVGCNAADIVPATILIEDNQYVNDQVTILPDAALNANTLYYLYVGSQVENSTECGRNVQGIVFSITFTTVP